MALELVTFDHLKAFLGLEGATISDYPDLSVIRESVYFGIESYLGRFLEATERTEEIRIKKSKLIPLKGLPVTAISSITSDGDAVDSDYYDIDSFGLRLKYTATNELFSITYTGGYATADDVPDLIKRAASIQTIFEWQSKENIAATSVISEGGTTIRPEFGILEAVKQLLNPYMHPFKISS